MSGSFTCASTGDALAGRRAKPEEAPVRHRVAAGIGVQLRADRGHAVRPDLGREARLATHAADQLHGGQRLIAEGGRGQGELADGDWVVRRRHAVHDVEHRAPDLAASDQDRILDERREEWLGHPAAGDPADRSAE